MKLYFRRDLLLLKILFEEIFVTKPWKQLDHSIDPRVVRRSSTIEMALAVMISHEKKFEVCFCFQKMVL